jgi:hypothetical protein
MSTDNKNHDYVTVYTLNDRANKLVTRKVGGEVQKDAGPPIYEAMAQTARISTPEDMLTLQQEISKTPNRVISLGYVPGTEPTDSAIVGIAYRVTSKKNMGKALGVDPETTEGLKSVQGWHEVNGERTICRLKNNMVPGSWCLLDIDAVRGMPEHMANLNSEERRDAIAEVFPAFADAGLVVAPSTTGRVRVDGGPMDATGEHYYLQIEDPDDLGRFGAVMLQRSVNAGWGFMRPRHSIKNRDVVVAHVPWGINDPTTFSHERIIYEGAPTLDGEGLTLAEPRFELIDGGRLDTHQLKVLDDVEAQKYFKLTGQRLVRSKKKVNTLNADGEIEARLMFSYSTVDEVLLSMDTKIETKAGIVTLEGYWKSDSGKLRCQTPFRESTSDNGILNRHTDGTPFVYDNGIRTRYILPKDEIRKHRADIYCAKLSLRSVDEIKSTWTDGLRYMENSEQEKIRQRVHKLTDVPLKELASELKMEIDRWLQEDARERNAALKEEIEDQGRTTIMVSGVDLEDILQDVEDVLFKDKTYDPVMSHGGRLVTVRMDKPTTVREVRKERDAAKDETPLSMIVDPYQFYSLRARVIQSIAFIEVDWTTGALSETPPQTGVLRAMIEKSHKNAPALVGIIEHPVMGRSGEILSTKGLSDEGLFINIKPSLVPQLSEKITRKQAAKSLRWLLDIALEDFPFATDQDMAGAVAALLTAVQRRMFDRNEGCPGFLTTAPIQASGKTALFQLLFELVWGRSASATNWSSSDEELGKHILAILLEGHGGVLFDNLEEGSQIESNALARAMTAPKFTGRMLGENNQATVPTNCLWCFTGNNVAASGDFNTRILPIKIDPETENPEHRNFSRHDLAEWCEQNRREFFHHAMVIVVGYYRHLAAGGAKPDIKPSRYSTWDTQVRQALIWAGGGDPAELFEINKAEDPKLEGRRNLLSAWFDTYESEPMMLGDILRAVDAVPPDTESANDRNLRQLDEAIHDLLPNGRPSSRALAKVLRRFVGRPIDGLRLVSEAPDSKSKKAKHWRVECAA